MQHFSIFFSLICKQKITNDVDKDFFGFNYRYPNNYKLCQKNRHMFLQ